MADHQSDSNLDEFDQSDLNTVRRKDRASYDKHQIADIFRQAKICHVSFVHDHLPQCIPMIGALDETEEGDVFVYFHGDLSPNYFCAPTYWRQRLSKESLHPGPAGKRNADDGDCDDNGWLRPSPERISPLDELPQRGFARRLTAV
jgi:hypothetical protein